jgi:hypothetical protein
VQEADEVLLFVRRQLRTEYEIEEFNRIVKGSAGARRADTAALSV